MLLLRACFQAVPWWFTVLWLHSDTQEAVGVLGCDLLRGAACPCWTSLLSATVVPLTPLAPVLSKNITYFYYFTAGYQASLHLTLQKKFSWTDPWGSKAETGIWSVGRAVRQLRAWEPSAEHWHVPGCSMLQYSVHFCCWLKCLFWYVIISNNFWAIRINNILLLLLLLSIDCTVFSLSKICGFLNKMFL